jgi:hypothetical protein
MKWQLTTWKAPRKKKPPWDRLKGKVLLEVFFNWSGTSHGIHSIVIANKYHYNEILDHLRSSICCNRPELWHRINWLLLHDNALAHSSVLVQEDLAK